MVVVYLVMQRRQAPAYRPMSPARPTTDYGDTGKILRDVGSGIGWLINEIRGIGDDEPTYRYGSDRNALEGGIYMSDYGKQDDTGAAMLGDSDQLYA